MSAQLPPVAVGQIIPSSFDPGIVTASYFASFVGCFLTIEQLNRRKTGYRNVASWVSSIMCAISMGLVGIWCMHYIGNVAIRLGDGHKDLQLDYTPGYTILSAFLPVVGLTIAFTVAELPTLSPFWHWTFWGGTGIFAGLSIVGMHYVGNLAINNYGLDYSGRFVGASITIAVGDSFLTLLLFYQWRERWISNVWKRALCAGLLAGGVSAMHFTAATDCTYRFRHYVNIDVGKPRTNAAIVAGALCCLSLLAIIGLMLESRSKMQRRQQQSREISIACMFFSEDGRVLLNADGSVPNRKIAEQYNNRKFEEDFDTGHPIFHWLYRVSRNWSSVIELLPQMRNHYVSHKSGSVVNLKSARNGVAGAFPPESYHDFTIVFREAFCIAVASMASELHIAIGNMGVLYDDIIDTGLTERTMRDRLTGADRTHGLDIEALAGKREWGSGQLLILTRRLSQREVEQNLNAGMRFSYPREAARPLAEQLQMPPSVFQLHMGKLDQYIKKQYTSVPHGVYLALFALVPTLSDHFDILVKKGAEDQLPDVQLFADNHTDDITTFLQLFNGETPEQMAISVQVLLDHHPISAKERFVAERLLMGINELRLQSPAHWFKRAKFSAKPQKVYYSQALRQKPNTIWLYAFVVVGDLNTSLSGNNHVTAVPLKFLNVRHMCFPGSPNHLVLAREIHIEFGPILAHEAGEVKRPLKAFMRRGRRLSAQLAPSRLSATYFPRRSISPPSNGSLELVSLYQPRRGSKIDPDSGPGTSVASIDMGGIMVNSTTVVNSYDDESSNDDKIGPGAPARANQGVSTDAALEGTTITKVSVAKYEPTFIDVLSEVAWGWHQRFRW